MNVSAYIFPLREFDFCFCFRHTRFMFEMWSAKWSGTTRWPIKATQLNTCWRAWSQEAATVLLSVFATWARRPVLPLTQVYGQCWHCWQKEFILVIQWFLTLWDMSCSVNSCSLANICFLVGFSSICVQFFEEVSLMWSTHGKNKEMPSFFSIQDRFLQR